MYDAYVCLFLINVELQLDGIITAIDIDFSLPTKISAIVN